MRPEHCSLWLRAPYNRMLENDLQTTTSLMGCSKIKEWSGFADGIALNLGCWAFANPNCSLLTSSRKGIQRQDGMGKPRRVRRRTIFILIFFIIFLQKYFLFKSIQTIFLIKYFIENIPWPSDKNTKLLNRPTLHNCVLRVSPVGYQNPLPILYLDNGG